MSDADQVSQALAELWDMVKCCCDEAYTGRGLHDPYCQCDSADAVQTVADHIEALTKERDQHWDSFVHWHKQADDLTGQLAAARQDAKEAEAYAEELEKERDDYAHKLMQANNTYTEMHLEIERLSDKLAKAMEGQKIKALEQILEERGAVFDAMVDAAEDAAGKDVSFNVVIGRALRAALAELKGESRDPL